VQITMFLLEQMNFQKWKNKLDAYLVYNKTFDKLFLMLQQDIHIKMGL
jgi:hypothetical protein